MEYGDAIAWVYFPLGKFRKFRFCDGLNDFLWIEVKKAAKKAVSLVRDIQFWRFLPREWERLKFAWSERDFSVSDDTQNYPANLEYKHVDHVFLFDRLYKL